MSAGRWRMLRDGVAALTVSGCLLSLAPIQGADAQVLLPSHHERAQQAGNIDVEIIGEPIVGRPIEVEIRAANPVGDANQGSITVSLPGNPNVDIVRASVRGARVYQPGEPMFNFQQAQALPIAVPAVELFVSPWPSGASHSLRLRLTARSPYSLQARATFRRANGSFVTLPATGQIDQQGAPTRLIDIAPRQPAPPTAAPRPTRPPPPTSTPPPPPATNTAIPTDRPAEAPEQQQPPVAQKPSDPPTQPPAVQPTTPPAPPLGLAPTAAPTPAPAAERGPSMPLLLAGFGMMALGLATALVALLLVLRRRSDPAGGSPSSGFGPPFSPTPATPYGTGRMSAAGGGTGSQSAHGEQGGYHDSGEPPPASPAAPWGMPPPGTPPPLQTAPWQTPASGAAPPHWTTPTPPGYQAGATGTPRPSRESGPASGVTPASERYIDRQLIGQGGMGAVFKAYDARLHRWVALKIMHADLKAQPGFLERFIREARVAAMLDHPNIVTVYDIEPVGDSIHMVMAWIDGEDLQKIIRREGGLPLDRTAHILDQVASALDAAHRAPQPVLHRDIKPSNIMVGPDDRAILTDFGIARLIGDAALTQVGQMVGTPAYMAPELVRGEDADGRADVYALGVVLFEMLTGRTPFKAETPLALLHQQVYTPPPAARTVAPQLPSGVDGVLMRALAKDRSQRFQTAGALARAYRAAVGLT